MDVHHPTLIFKTAELISKLHHCAHLWPGMEHPNQSDYILQCFLLQVSAQTLLHSLTDWGVATMANLWSFICG